MNGYVQSAFFIYDEEGKEYEEVVVNNPHGVTVTSLPVEEFTEKISELLNTPQVSDRLRGGLKRVRGFQE